jgi:serine/threonine-protein kinase
MTGRNPEAVDFGPFRFVPGDGLWRNGSPLPLPPRAMGVLATLVARPGSVVSKQELMDAVWPDTFVTESSLLEAIGLLRQTFGDDRRQPLYIQTVHRRGYRFIGRRVDSFHDPDPWRPIIVASAAYVVTTICVAVVFAVFGQHPQQPIERRTSRFSIGLSSEAPVDPLRGAVAVSADGSQMAYVAASGGRSRLFLRTIDRDEPTPIDGTEDATDPFFSPDGKWIGFFAHGSLQKLALDGGPPIALCAARGGAGAAWADDDTIVFGGGPGGGLARVSSRGGDPVVLATPAPATRELRFGWPDLLPGNRGIIFTAVSLDGSDVVVLDRRSGRRTVLALGAAFGRYAPTGHLIVERQGRLEAARFSIASLTTEAARPAVSGVSRSAMLEGPRFAFSRTGSLVYVPSDAAERDAPPHWLDAGGPIGEGHAVSPTWRPDGLEIAFAFSKAGPFNLFVKPVDGHAAEPLLPSEWNQFPTSWAPNARYLAFTEFQPMTGADIWVIDLQTRERRPVVRTLFDETWARFSPDGKWIAYMSNESGRWEVFVRPASGSGPRARVSSEGGIWPCWSADGKTIYFSTGGRTMAAAVRTAPLLDSSTPHEIPNAEALMLAGGASAADRLLVRQAGARPPGRVELRVVLDWFTELLGSEKPNFSLPPSHF